MIHRLRTFVLIAASPLAFAAIAAHAQESSSTTDAAPSTDTIVVTGIRGALENAEKFKRNSSVLVDGISADDIGAFPDESIADSLVRIPGLTANNNENGFAEVSIRGLGPDLANTTYNGRVLPSPRNNNRRLNLGELPTEGISRAYVQKTAAASTIEGGLGGTIGLESVHPLDTGRRGLSIVARGMTDDVSQDIKGVYGYKPWGYRGEVSYVGKLAPNLGVSFSYAHIQQTNAHPSTQLVDYKTRTLTPDADGDGYPDAVPNNAGINMGANNQRRDSVLAMVQWRPVESLTASLDGYYINGRDSSHPINFHAVNNATVKSQPTTYDAIDSIVRNYQGYTSLYQESVSIGHQTTRQIEGGFNLKYDNGGPISAILDLSYAQAKLSGHSIGATIKTRPNNPQMNAAGQIRPFGFDSTDAKNIIIDFGDQSADDYMLTAINENNPGLTDTAKAARLDFHYNRPLAFIGSMDFGMRVDDRIKDNNPNGNGYAFGGLKTNPALDASYLVDDDNPLGNAAHYLGGPAAVTFPLFDLDKLIALEDDPNAVFNEQTVNDYRGNSKITETTMALYYQANIKAGRRLTGNIGVRFFDTAESVDGYAVTATSEPTPMRVKNDYHFWLPSLNLRYAITHSLFARAALSKTLSRPQFSAMRIGSAIDFSTVQPNDTINRGNPDLKPYTSKNADLDLEWYPSKAMTLGVQGFYKAVTNFITDNNVDGTLTLPDGSTIPVTYHTQVNDPTVRHFYGFEVIARRDFDFLPGFLRHLGVRADYSHNWTDASQSFKSTDGTDVELKPNNFMSQIVNAQLYYSTRKLDFHIAYRYYSPYARENSNAYQSRPRGTLDLTGRVTLRRGVQLIGTIRNLTKTHIYNTLVDYRFPDAYGAPRNVIYPSRSFAIGIHARI